MTNLSAYSQQYKLSLLYFHYSPLHFVPFTISLDIYDSFIKRRKARYETSPPSSDTRRNHLCAIQGPPGTGSSLIHLSETILNSKYIIGKSYLLGQFIKSQTQVLTLVKQHPQVVVIDENWSLPSITFQLIYPSLLLTCIHSYKQNFRMRNSWL